MQIRLEVFAQSCKQTDKETDKQTDKQTNNDDDISSLAEVIKAEASAPDFYRTWPAHFCIYVVDDSAIKRELIRFRT